MPKQTHSELLHDHVDAGMLAPGEGAPAEGRDAIVQLDPDHPGFRDPAYRARRNRIARLASEHRPGSPPPDAPYTGEEHALWAAVLDRLTPAHREHACREYLEAFARLELPRNRIPQLREVSARAERLSGFRLEPVAGLVSPRVFLENLADGVFLCTQYIRHHSAPLYTPEPDVVHELLGHAVTLASPRLACLNRLVGRAVRRARTDDELERLSRVYWFTVEFGVVREGGGVKAYGTGLLSSAGELEAMGGAALRPLDLDAAARAAYDPTHFQPVLFCADSFDSMYETLRDYLLAMAA
jgi:phenylalanine-4-hydroxylase